MRGLRRWDEVLRRLPKTPAKLAEVGVWRGVQASHLLPAKSDLDMYLVDRWSTPKRGDSYSRSGSKISTYTQIYHDLALKMVRDLASQYPGRAHIIVSDSAEGARGFEDYSLDMVFIDADHSYEGCKRDILAWANKVKIGSYLGGHDYANKTGEVKRAVDELFPLSRIEFGPDHVWFVRMEEE